MKLVMTRRAEINLANQYEFGIQKFGAATARKTLARFSSFLAQTLLKHPRASTFHAEYQAFECWIPKTPFVIFYRIDEEADTLVVLAVFHHAQDRTQFTP